MFCEVYDTIKADLKIIDIVLFYSSESIYNTPYTQQTAVDKQADLKIIDIISFFISEPIYIIHHTRAS